MKVKKAIIPAAGLGTRFLPATKAQPKEMLPIVDKPTIQYIIEEAVASGIEEILIITGRNKRAIEDHFDKSVELESELEKKDKQDMLNMVKKISNMVNIYYIRQKEPRGLGHAINCAKTFVGDEPFAVMLGDDVVDSKTPCLKQLINCYNEYKTSILGVQEVPYDDVSKYGIVKGMHIEDGVYKVKDLIEKPRKEESPSNIAILGRYIINPRIFPILQNTKPGKGGEIQLTDALKTLAREEAMYAYIFEGRRYDVGDKLGFLQATVEFALKREKLKEPFMKYLINVQENENYRKLYDQVIMDKNEI
ncbi:UTP--glucose-1-phosphate uridylyltransferase GalU [Haloimpatiens sp. FM7330]|uniref:UTP--glucose-1-phosphate uridylyltransferase GalU n=1 Tax=Haloimpatiens sp. FM7330 TaxID=3298610 RepID=UPI00363751DD